MNPISRVKEIDLKFLSDDNASDLEYYCHMRDLAEQLELELHVATTELQSLHSIINQHQQRLDKIISALCLPSHSPTAQCSSVVASSTPSSAPEPPNTTKSTPESETVVAPQ